MWTLKSELCDDFLFLDSLMKCGTPITAVKNVNVRKTMAWVRLTATTKINAMEMLFAFKTTRANITASLQVL